MINWRWRVPSQQYHLVGWLELVSLLSTASEAALQPPAHAAPWAPEPGVPIANSVRAPCHQLGGPGCNLWAELPTCCRGFLNNAQGTTQPVPQGGLFQLPKP